MKKHVRLRPVWVAACVILGIALCVFAGEKIYGAILSATAETSRDKAPTVIIDPGHGGVDGGAVGVGGVVEKNINLSISLKLRAFFQASGFQVIMTREDDRSIYDPGADTIRRQKTTDLHNRLAIIKKNPNAVFISIHQNKFPDGQYSGTQMFYSPNNGGSKELASLLQKDIVSMLQPDNHREIKEAGKNLFILYYSKTPSVMVECGFLSNQREAALLQKDDYQQKMAFAIYYGTLHYYAAHPFTS